MPHKRKKDADDGFVVVKNNFLYALKNIDGQAKANLKMEFFFNAEDAKGAQRTQRI